MNFYALLSWRARIPRPSHSSRVVLFPLPSRLRNAGNNELQMRVHGRVRNREIYEPRIYGDLYARTSLWLPMGERERERISDEGRAARPSIRSFCLALSRSIARTLCVSVPMNLAYSANEPIDHRRNRSRELCEKLNLECNVRRGWFRERSRDFSTVIARAKSEPREISK